MVDDFEVLPTTTIEDVNKMRKDRKLLLLAAKKVIQHYIANGSGDIECTRELEAAVAKAER